MILGKIGYPVFYQRIRFRNYAHKIVLKALIIGRKEARKTLSDIQLLI